MSPAIAIAIAIAASAAAVPASAGGPAHCGWALCQSGHDGVIISTADRVPRRAAPSTKAAEAALRATARITVPGCPGNDPNVSDEFDLACAYMTDFCTTAGEPGSWLVWVWSRPAGSQQRWVKTGFACRSPQEVQAATPGVTQALVQRAFARVRFAHPQVHVQPEGDVTLVNLPTYYQVRWPVAGYEPGEVAAVRLLGRTVRLRPRAQSYTYWFGDGSRFGPTSDAGGPFPSGQVRHAYQRTGQVSVRVDAAYSGEYSMSGGPWQPIDLTVPVTGAAHTVQVKQARARLEPRPH